MKKNIIALIMALVLLTFSVVVLAGPQGLPEDGDRVFKFNIIGVPNDKEAPMDQNNGARIFVPLEGVSAINLVEGETFDILDANATDDTGALLQMPKPGYDPYILGTKEDPVWSDYSIYIRSLGKPGGWTTITTCAELLDSTFADLLPKDADRILNKYGIVNPDAYASIEQVGRDITERPKGKSVFTNVTAALTSIVFKVEVDMVDKAGNAYTEVFYVRVPIFDERLDGEYWEYDNNGLKLLQVWIYDNRTDITLSDDAILNPPE